MRAEKQILAAEAKEVLRSVKADIQVYFRTRLGSGTSSSKDAAFWGALGQIDEDGYLHIVGRSKDLIISGGYNIYPKEIELLLDEEEGVLESAVIGVPHPDFGETVVGILVAEGKADLDLDGIKKRIGASLARFKHPQRLVVLPELPRNTMGKVQKKELREQFKDIFMPALSPSPNAPLT